MDGAAGAESASSRPSPLDIQSKAVESGDLHGSNLQTQSAAEVPLVAKEQRKTEMQGLRPGSGSVLPSGVRAVSTASTISPTSPHHRSASFGTGSPPAFSSPIPVSVLKAGPSAMKHALSSSISRSPAPDSQRNASPLDLTQLQRMDLVKARNGSVLSRGLILKTDFYPSGESILL